MTYTSILKIVPTLQAASLVKHNVNVAQKKNLKTKDMIDLGVTNIVGTNLIKIESDFISGLWI